ncbi:chaperonin GroS protein [Toxoplasma gondii TgCatPRC2]|uniref:10 kDa chaperonin, putative n=9 Tax=Toxoplasma gondii TaxID=5811 RepID=A0A0F7V4K0_TOXGV|nr:chaperonin GroS protein [Toxoplasma gondii ME49]EPT28701.1 chaperonin GroS protein [Toxoplasma gondii ME49]ESS36045.1 chaperonin GroS protein [Toxoplasma gondii VEG]KYK71414.1 chaperonin GroS protein [Toxoplasma gondii TgCatPRC2]CEL75065.1 TPA: 10 kDa chaperonin, putative [Toxoplasma gondii VEG]|eukprot:XP_018636742.1 chaperonin GroS protein [Toxoplasma gondii ME49]
MTPASRGVPLGCTYTAPALEGGVQPSRRIGRLTQILFVFFILGLASLSSSLFAHEGQEETVSPFLFAVGTVYKQPGSVAPTSLHCAGSDSGGEGFVRSSERSLAFVRGQPSRSFALSSPPAASSAFSPAVQEPSHLVSGPTSLASRDAGVGPLRSASNFSFEGEDIRGPIKPLRGMVLLERREAVEKSAGGVYLPIESKAKQVIAKVIEVGPGEVNRETGARIPVDVAIGDWTIISRHTYDSFKYNGKDCVLVEARDIIAKVQTTTEERDANPSDILPLGDTILVKLVKQAQRTASGLYLQPTGSERDRGQGVKRAQVVAVGLGRYNRNGERVPNDVVPGDEVLFPAYSQDEPEMKYGGESYAFVRAADLLAKW